MTVILYICIICYVLAAAFLVLTILMQEGKGGGLSGIGGGAIGDTFGFSNASTELRKLTRYSAIIFCVLALALTFLGEHLIQNTSNEFLKGAETEESAPAPVAQEAAPAAPAAQEVAPAPAATPAPVAEEKAPVTEATTATK